jgi:hypothetical protein
MTMTYFVKTIRVLFSGITQHEEENFILTTVKTLDPGQKDDNRNFFFNTNKTSNFVVRLPCGTYPRIGIECISILKLATILLRGAKESVQKFCLFDNSSRFKLMVLFRGC